MVERLRQCRGRRSLLAGLAGASLIRSVAGLPQDAIAKNWGFAAGVGRGGGIANSGDLTLREVTVSFCEADKGGGIALVRFSTLTMNANCVVKRNTSRDDGGGILNDGTVTMNEGSFVTENTALGRGGGGIGGFGSWITLNPGSTVQGNEPNDCDTESGACE